MSGLLNHPVQRIIQQLLIDDGTFVTDPDDDDLWPCYANQLPDAPDECVAVRDTEGKINGREMATGLLNERPGIQIRTRSNGPSDGFIKSKRIMEWLNRNVNNETVIVMDETGTSTDSYLIQTIIPTSTVIRMGPEGSSHRYLFSTNHVISLRML